MSTRVYLVQLLCPERHCILAAAGAYEHATKAVALVRDLEKRFAELVEEKVLNPYCGICSSRNLTTELRPTGFTTMEEALPVLLELQEAQRQTREYLKSTRN